MKTKISETKHHTTAAASLPERDDPVPALLAAHNVALPLKALPVFDLGSKKEENLSRTTSTATTLTLIPSPNKEPSSSEARFQFSQPLPATPQRNGGGNNVDDVVANGIVFSFCQPEEVGTPSPTNAYPDISMHKNHAAATLPDLTNAARGMLPAAPSSLKLGGSVMDVLNRKPTSS